MEILVQRQPSKDGATISRLYVNGVFECYVLEDEIREIKGKPVAEWKIAEKTAIPAGRYKIIITMSNRFKKKLPLLLAVAGFEGVRIHAGNTAENTEGCLLVGQAVKGNVIVGGTSRPALDALQRKIQAVLDAGENVWVTIKNPVQK